MIMGCKINRFDTHNCIPNATTSAQGDNFLGGFSRIRLPDLVASPPSSLYSLHATLRLAQRLIDDDATELAICIRALDTS